ncbi:prepilin peptidase, partial [Candidatus Uhrbacteria bacterium]|nr:prepilin peptidase [Candidatus Uhrbacteria bacterium]
MIVFSFLIFILGACLGSFLNVAIIRLKDASSMWGRSKCPECGKKIRSRHLVPILSWFLLHGCCADCHKPIHFQYPLVEFAAGLLMLVAFFRHNFFLTPSALEPFLFELIFSYLL